MPIGQFALVFTVAYAALKWNYIIPLIWNQAPESKIKSSLQTLNVQNWIFAIAGLSTTLLQNLLNYKTISQETSYLTGLVALLTVIIPKSNAWMASATAIHLELINILIRGQRNEKIVSGIVLGLVFVATAANAKKSLLKLVENYAIFVVKN